MLETFALLVFAHFLADYPLQGEFLAKGKNATNPIPGIPYWHPMTAHAAIQGGFVGIITGSVWLGVVETVLHWIIDNEKCRGRISYNVDQAAHILCKVVWAVIVAT